eukprot:TRINITY_DN16075_c0_g1::TRINITY_DN16075_c0_g1_i1::g.13822::m.13822 TRINITY_DN16075_c0_g1::TRINITY_DN16075_c0_g1_i1::g.13822  ORF type:complete len:149 (+),score=52.77,sp/O82204/RL281_ARATH/42.62/5e-22,Ribosomal_L28e/PF01778.12/5.1e-33,Ribosomal_L24e/PF01246.15/0.063 TRINITY_DN16075_c0_g1_i1:50-448(+)
MSSELIWQVIRKNNAYLVKRDGLQLSSEAANLTHQHSYKFSGLANKKAVAITAIDGGCKLSIKKKTASRKPASGNATQELKRDFRRVARSISGALDSYRPDLKKAALAKWSAIYRSQHKKSTDAKATKRSRK